MGIYQEIGEKFENATQILVSQSISSIITEITPVVSTGVIIYLLITGFMIIAGRISEPIGDIIIKGIKIIIIATVALNTGKIMSVVVGGINGLEKMFSNAIAGDSGKTVYQILDDNFDTGMLASAQIIEAMLNIDFDIGAALALFITLLIVLASTILITILAGALYIMTKVSLAVVLGLSPFFIASLFFPVTARWFDSWLSQAINYALTGAIIVFLSTLAFSSFSNLTTEVITQVQSDVSFPATEMGQLIIHSIVCFFAMKQAPSIASGLAGGIGISGVSLLSMAATARNAAFYDFEMFRFKKPNNNQNNSDKNSDDKKPESSTDARRAKLLDRLRGNSIRNSR